MWPNHVFDNSNYLGQAHEAFNWTSNFKTIQVSAHFILIIE